MRLQVLGSSSAGNCYLLSNKDEILIIEAGMPMKHVLEGIDYQIAKVVGCIITHEHGDHSKHADKLAERGVKIYATKGTIQKINPKDSLYYRAIKEGLVYNIGGFQIFAFKAVHDAEEPVSYFIKHRDLGVMLFATDTSHISHSNPDMNHILIECNYIEEKLRENDSKGIIFNANRIRDTHMSLEGCIDYLKQIDISKVRNIIPIHLSGDNSTAEDVKYEIEKAIGFPVTVACKGLDIQLNRNIR